MAKNNSLTAKQKKGLAALLQSSTHAEAAALAGVSDFTLYRWKRQPVFKAALDAELALAIRDARMQLVQDLVASHDRLREIRDNPHEATSERRKSATELARETLRWTQFQTLLDLAEEVEKLKEAYATLS